MPIQQSVCYPMMQPLPMPLEELFPRVAAMGFAAVEIWKPDSTVSAVAELAHKNHLVLASFSGHDSLANGLNNPAEHTRIVDELGRSIDMAAEWGVPGIICFSGNHLSGQSEEEAIAATAAGLRQIAPYAESKNVNLNLELLNSKVDHPGYQCDHAAWGLAVTKAVNSRCVKLLYDIYHMQIMEGDLIATITENIQWIGHFHTAGVPGRRDLDDAQEINYRGVMQAIAATGYPLYVGHEFRPKGDLLAALQQAYTLCHVA
jgi:hydroxypyruvate isomerase